MGYLPLFLQKVYWGGYHFCVVDSEEEYFDFEESSEPTDGSLIKGEEIRNEPAKEELTDLQLKFEIKEVRLLNSILTFYLKNV